MSATAGTDRMSMAPDRRNLPNSLLAAIAASTALSVGLATQTLPSASGSPATGFLGGLVAGGLAVVTLRSVSVRSTASWMCIVGALMILRFGGLPTGPLGASVVIVGWVFATTTAMVMGARAVRYRNPATGPGAPAGATTTTPRTTDVFRGVGRTIMVVGCIVSAAAIGLGPAAADAFSTGARDGNGINPGEGSRGNALAPTRSLDMTNRPRLTDKVVLTVATDQAGFWRGQTFDQWDGSTWTRTDETLLDVPDSGEIQADEFDLAATAGTEVTQEFRVEAQFAASLPALPSARVVDATAPLLQWPDGSLLAPNPLGSGATYSVVSSRPPVSEELLRDKDAADIPEAVLRRYALPPTATERVRKLATSITEGATSNFDKVRAIEKYLGDTTEYSLDAPLSPSGTDVVDHFLFTSKLGWCEQISSSLTVLLRLSGVPARLATGYVPGDRDPVTGRYIVRERDAHAWTEVWFPDVGWVPFDPTANVSLAGEVDQSAVATFLARYGAILLLGLGLVFGFGTVVVNGVRRLLAKRRARRGGSGAPGRRFGRGEGTDVWPVEVDVRLDRLGKAWGRERAPSETSTAYSSALAGTIGDGRLPIVGEVVDRARYSPGEPSAEERSAIGTILDEIPKEPPAP